MTTRDYRLTCLSPVHVGCGVSLSKAAEMVDEGEATYIIDLDAAIRAYADFFARGVHEPKDILRHLRKKGGDTFLRRVEPTIQAEELSLQMRDGRGALLIPGSTLKGALRTVVLWYAAQRAGNRQCVEMHLQEMQRMTRLRPQFAAADLEKELLRGGRGDTRSDLLRAIMVGDCALEADFLGIYQVRTRSPSREDRTREEGYVLACEGVRTASEGYLRIGIDDFLLDHRLEAGLPDDIFEDLLEIADASKEFALRMIDEERRYFQRSPLPAALTFLRQLEELVKQAPQGTIFLRLGWGIGWCSSTGALADPGDRLQLLAYFERLRRPISKLPSKAYDVRDLVFPKSRRYIQGTKEPPLFGFVKLEPVDGVPEKPFEPVRWPEVKISAQVEEPSPTEGPRVRPSISERSALELFLSNVRSQDVKGRFEGLIRRVEAEQDLEERRKGLRMLWDLVVRAVPRKDKAFYQRADVVRLREAVEGDGGGGGLGQG